MKSINNQIHKKLHQLNYQSILIVTYGRSGSTLLQGVLNTIDGVVVRGENFNMCFHLFQAYISIQKSKIHEGHVAQNPFYGSEMLDEAYFLDQAKDTVKHLLLADQKSEFPVRAYGFKEIRYWETIENFNQFLDFLQKIFPDVCFLFNTRKKEDVVKSWVSVNMQNQSEEKEINRIIDKTEVAFADYMKENPTNTFHITYEDVIGKTARLESLFSFIGASYNEKKIDHVLSLKHSYRPNQDHINHLAIKPSTKKDKIGYRQSMNILIEKHECIYFIIPKNACSSMKAQIVEILGLEKGENFPNGIHDPEVYPYPFVKTEQISNKYQEYLRFCIVRNPWDRLVSCYKDKIRSIDYNSAMIKNGVALPLLENSPRFYGGMPFDEFVDVVCDIPDSIAEHHFQSQLYQLTDKNGHFLVNYIGKLETLNEDLNEISQLSGIVFSNFPHHHKTNKKPYTEYYNEETVEKVRSRFEADINFFNYEFGQTKHSKIGYLNEEQKGRMTHSTSMISIMKQKIRQSNAKLFSSKNRKIFVLENELKIKNRIINGMKDSLSWKITAPMRKLAIILGLAPRK